MGLNLYNLKTNRQIAKLLVNCGAARKFDSQGTKTVNFPQ